ncbi:unnamed protein product, partial [Trichobilharzia regenti]
NEGDKEDADDAKDIGCVDKVDKLKSDIYPGEDEAGNEENTDELKISKETKLDESEDEAKSKETAVGEYDEAAISIKEEYGRESLAKRELVENE